jgi:hypothetical protein
MNNQLEKLQLDLVRYREAVDHVFTATLVEPRDCQKWLLEILVCASQLYVDYLLVVKHMPELETVASKRGALDVVQSNSLRERSIRERLRQELETSPCWGTFRPENPFSELTGLRSLQDYMDKFTLHLPEIYEETFRVEVCVKSFLANHNSAALAQTLVGLQHLGRNHISFVLQALEWAADEGSWEESLASKAP